jgi:pyridoxamine 5'-phosphate oxidase
VDESDLDRDPIAQLRRWYDDACAVVKEPDAAAVATATPDGRPSARIVLVKRFDENGLVFFTNYGSRKGGELEANPRAALLFHWADLGRQVRVEGPVERLPREDSTSYAHSRPRMSQLSALASPQSQPVPNREWLEQRVRDLDDRHAGRELPVRDDWGGFRVKPEAWEFWQHRDNRLHDRFRYLPQPEGGWRIERLGP